MFTGGHPVLLGAGVDLEHVGPRAEDGLLPRETHRVSTCSQHRGCYVLTEDSTDPWNLFINIYMITYIIMCIYIIYNINIYQIYII